MLNRRSQYQFYWGGEKLNYRQLVPNGKYKIHVRVNIYNSKGKIIAKRARYWGRARRRRNSSVIITRN